MKDLLRHFHHRCRTQIVRVVRSSEISQNLGSGFIRTVFGIKRKPPLPVTALFPVVECLQNRLLLFPFHHEGHSPTTLFRLGHQCHHSARRSRDTSMIRGALVETSGPSRNKANFAFGEWEIRPPNQRAISKHPKIILHRFLHPCKSLPLKPFNTHYQPKNNTGSNRERTSRLHPSKASSATEIYRRQCLRNHNDFQATDKEIQCHQACIQ